MFFFNADPFVLERKLKRSLVGDGCILLDVAQLVIHPNILGPTRCRARVRCDPDCINDDSPCLVQGIKESQWRKLLNNQIIK